MPIVKGVSSGGEACIACIAVAASTAREFWNPEEGHACLFQFSGLTVLLTLLARNLRFFTIFFTQMGLNYQGATISLPAKQISCSYTTGLVSVFISVFKSK